MRKLALLLVLFAPLAASGQSIITISPQQCVWRAGDNPAWAAPTCVAVRVDPDGRCLIANAGYLSPYRNGEEVSMESCLPLGVTSDVRYVESALSLAAGETLTFLSDGVVEARNARGELFGFERTRAIIRNSAEDIARGAQSFGQQDNITVLTLTFAPAEVLHA
jgi:hypothetical protein